MHFKSLELVGFKSFADKTKLNFEPGVTAIVGPNGCGKSNVADSIRWVLGEQSAKSLRASKMEDVIFNGTDTKEPINFAEVSLTFSNENRKLPIDFDEVTITRRVFRSGDTEYLLNKTPVRLKDISELLMGTGVGTESYSIIEQGKMDLILSSKPEDRRYVFEEASGITKYKAKKKEALRKLEQTEQNLLRISDIIQEVKRQISSIERQARKAERYKEDFEKLKEIETKISFFDFRNLKTQEAEYIASNDDLREREKEIDAEIQNISSDIAKHRQALDQIVFKSMSLKTKQTELSTTIEKNNHKIEINRERVLETKSSQESLKKEIDSLGEKLNLLKALVLKLKDSLVQIEDVRQKTDSLIREKEEAILRLSGEIDSSDQLIKSSKVRTLDLLSKETRVKNELIKLGADVQNRRARERRLNIEKETVNEQLEASLAVLDSISKEYDEIQGGLTSLKGELDAKKSLDINLLQEMQNIQDALAAESSKKISLNSKIEFLEDLVKRHEGFQKGVKNILVKLDSEPVPISGVLGVVANLVTIENGYEEAVNAFLGDDVQTVITERDIDSIRAIEYLRNNKLGKANFISLETADNISRASTINTSAMTPLKNFVKMDGRFAKILDFLFNGAYLVDSLEDSAQSFSGSFTECMVTKNGSIYNKGRLSGGSFEQPDESTLLIGRKDRIESLKAELFNSESKIAALETAKRDKEQNTEALKAEIRALEEGAHAKDITLANIRSKKDSHDSIVKNLREELSVTSLELDEVLEAVNELSKKGEVLNAELNGIEKENSELQLHIEQSQASILSKRSERENLVLESTTLKTQNQSRIREVESLRANLEKEEKSLFEVEDSAMQKSDILNESYEKIKIIEEENVALASGTQSVSEELKVVNSELSTIESGKTEISDKLSFGEIHLKEKERELESVRNQMRDADVKLTELSYKKSGLKERMSQVYKFDLETIHVDLEDSVDWESMKAQSSEIKEKLDRMGPVNLVAIDEHKELEERYSFLTRQQEDLVNAKDSLLKAIQKINKTTKELFLDAFQKIQVEFKAFFKTLFGGGQAELVLIDEQDVLESGIEIIVRPPGKKLQNIMLLSGGEKALTAISLLFAIFKVNPSPFCILDEIDAPLDESNVVRFSSVLRDFLKISQFIIITHNKRTIELADVMYGVTMQERGVSKIVSVKFLENKKKMETAETVEKQVAPQETSPEIKSEVSTPTAS